MRQLNALDNWLARIEGGALCIALLTMIFLAFMQVVARNIFDTGILWAEAVVRGLVLWVGLLGAILAAKRGQHLSIDALTKFFKGRSKKILSISLKFFSTVVCLLLLSASLDFVQMEKEAGAEFFKHMPYWCVELIIPIAFTLMPFHFVVGILNEIKDLLSGGEVS